MFRWDIAIELPMGAVDWPCKGRMVGAIVRVVYRSVPTWLWLSQTN